jgi:protein-S-isoprenylcysteine O-methyltransferase Ste14
MRPYWFPKRYADLAARLRVPCGFLLVAAFAYFSAPTFRSLAVGLPVAASGLLLRAWAAGHLAKNERLAISGPYAYVRNPLYLGTLLAALGFALGARRWLLGALFAAVFVLIYLPVVELEEQYLNQLFPDYAAYAARVPRLFPRWPHAPSDHRFRWALYGKNQEYQALLGFLAGVAWLVWRAW